MPITGDDMGAEYRGFRIKEIWAYVSIDPQYDDEGVIGIFTLNGYVPMIASDRMRMLELAPHAQRIATEGGQKVQLVKFSNRELVREFEPAAAPYSHDILPTDKPEEPGGLSTPAKTTEG